ncbi:hypothetical protein Lser_V15G24618 [Lactuca serriola]
MKRMRSKPDDHLDPSNKESWELPDIVDSFHIKALHLPMDSRKIMYSPFSDYVFTFEKGRFRRPFARLWWDENVSTVLTIPKSSQPTLHLEQDRVLTVRECARLQGFPNHYRFCGNVKERYCQVGNVVAVSVSKTLGYALGIAFGKLSGDEALMTLPPGFAFQVPPPPLEEFSSQL